MIPREDFQFILSPTPLESFAAHYWEKRSLHITRDSPKHFSSLFCLEQLDQLINLSFTNIGIFSFEGARVISPRPRPPTKTTLSEFYKEFSAGRSLSLRDMHVRWEPISKLISALGRQSGFSLSADLIASPPHSRNAGIFADSQSLFVLQLEGTATWRIPNGRFQPLAKSPEETLLQGLESDWRVSLKPGDTLYLPLATVSGGLPPEQRPVPLVETGDGHCLHLVLPVQRVTWADLLATVVELASSKDVELRRALGFGGPLRLPDQAQARFRASVSAAFSSPSYKKASHVLACEHRQRLPSLADGHFEQLRHVDKVEAETVVGRRPGVDTRVQLFDGVAELLFPGHFYQGPEKLFLALEFISETRQFKVKEIPGWYTDSERVLLVKQLISMGILTLARPATLTSSESQP